MKVRPSDLIALFFIVMMIWGILLEAFNAMSY